MHDLSLQFLVAALTAIPLVLLYWVGRFVARRRLRAALQHPRPLQEPTLRGWVEQGWLDPELLAALPGELSPAVVFYEWAWADPEVVRHWRFREPVTRDTSLEALVDDVWRNLPESNRERARERLVGSVAEAGTWWGGAERGWNRRPLSVPAKSVGRKDAGLPVMPLEDLSAAPMRGMVTPDVERAEMMDLVLALAVLRHGQWRFMHPLAPRNHPTGSLLEGMSTQVGADLGRRVGGGLGAALGPIGVMVGQYLGGMAGAFGGKALVQKVQHPEAIAGVLKDTESSLGNLGRLVNSDDFARAVRQPADAVLKFGQQIEMVREARSRRLRERWWPTSGLVLTEELLRVALRELQAYRAAADFFLKVARQAPEAVAGGMIMQNPWLVRSLPGSVERLNAARSSLNRAAVALARAYQGRQ